MRSLAFTARKDKVLTDAIMVVVQHAIPGTKGWDGYHTAYREPEELASVSALWGSAIIAHTKFPLLHNYTNIGQFRNTSALLIKLTCSYCTKHVSRPL